MSDAIKHECGVAFIRLLKPLEFYKEKYGSAFYGLKKLYLLLEKQHNRGQDGTGVVSVKLGAPQGKKYIYRERSIAQNSISEVFENIQKQIDQYSAEDKNDIKLLEEEVPFASNIYLGHLRYGTHGKNTIDTCHPFHRQNNWMTRNLVLAGNFNITNVEELFQQLVEIGQHPFERADTVLMLEKIGHFLDSEVQRLFLKFKEQGLSNFDITAKIAEKLDIATMLRKAFHRIDGGYTMVGIAGHGDAFAIRDPHGIRPCYYYHDDEIVIVTSERPAIQTAFNVKLENIHELTPGSALIVKASGEVKEEQIIPACEKKACSFERIYFSRGNDADIYKERKKLGYLLSDIVLKESNYDYNNTVFSYIPNTAATCFYGMIDGFHDHLWHYKRDMIRKHPEMSDSELENLIKLKPRREKIALKDVKLRTFITDDSNRDDLVGHVYDVTYGIVKPTDTLVVVDDSIVRGTTLKLSILRILDRLGPKKIVVVSSAPIIKYPDCYGIDMSKMHKLVAFQALLKLLKEHNLEHKLEETYRNALAELEKPMPEQVNSVKALYDLFTDEQLSKKIAEIVKPEDINAELSIIYQTIDNLHEACPHNLGDWYFSGDYPTPGGVRVANKAFINFYEGKDIRPY